MKRCCLLKNPPWVSDGFEGFRAGCVCLHVMRQGFRVETPEFGSKRPLYIGSYVVLKYDEASKIMVPQIAWWGIHLIAGTSFWWIRHLLVRWWLGMIFAFIETNCWGSAGPKDLCSQMLRAMCKASGDEETLGSYHGWCKGISTDWFFRWGQNMAKQSWLMTKQAHISCFSYFVNLQTSLCSKFFSSGCSPILAFQACLKMTKVKGAGFKHSAYGWANHPSGKPCWNLRLLV